MDLRKQIVFVGSTPLAYKMGNSTFHIQVKFVSAVAVLGLLCLIMLFLALPSYNIGTSNLTSNFLAHSDDDHKHTGRKNNFWFTYYNRTYPLTPPVYSVRGVVKYRIGIVSDLDVDSKDKQKQDTWYSYMMRGWLTLNLDNHEVKSIDWDKDVITFSSQYSYGGRGMELSELITFNGHLYGLDDRTGIVYELDTSRNVAVPWVILSDGNGKNNKGFKAEWATVKDETLIVGGLGKEFTSSTGEILNHDPLFVKTVNAQGFVQHHDWSKNYKKMLSAEHIASPGYMIHESCSWSEAMKRWLFLPRRASREMYNDKEDERKGTNLLIQATEGFEDIEISRVGDLIDTHGFSSFKFIPDTKDSLILALRSEEVQGKTAAYVMVFDVKGKILYPEKKVADFKFEGIEFI